MKNAAGVEYETPWAIICPRHKSACLSKEEYQRQLNGAEDLWTCPICDRVSDWDFSCPATYPDMPCS